MNPGQAPMTQGAQQNLRSAVASQSPPPNPETPDKRVDSADSQLLDLQRIRKSILRANDSVLDGTPIKKSYGIMLRAVELFMQNSDPQFAIDGMFNDLSTVVSPQAKQRFLAQNVPPPMAQGGGGSPMGLPGMLGGGASAPPQMQQAPLGAGPGVPAGIPA